VARRVALAVVEAGCTVVSGLARGIDGHAHRATLGHGRTVAVVGHGLASTSPASHRTLRRSLVEHGGAVVSTWPDEVRAARHTFPLRNRWIAGLARQVVVVEAPRRSGALITAEFASAIGRAVWAVPGRLGADEAAGCLALIEREQAVPLTSVEAFARALGGSPRASGQAWLRRVFGGADLAEVARDRGISHTELLTELARLEVEGRVVRLPGRRYAPGGGPR
jgi:DNA processing protein